MCFSKETKIYNKTIMVIQYKLMFVVKKKVKDQKMKIVKTEKRSKFYNEYSNG